jgi:xylulokinase
VAEMSDAAGTLWLDVAQRAWSPAALEASYLNLGQMPALVEGIAVSGYLTQEAAEALGLKAGLPVAGGAGDNAASAIGIGAIKPGDAFLSLGTSGVIFSVTDGHRPNTADAVHAFCHALPQGWHQMAVMLSAASCLRWVKDLTRSASEEVLLESVSALSAGQRAQAPIFLPYLSGERTPHNASACFIGLRAGHGAADLAYSVIEGVGFGLRDGLAAMQNAGTRVTSAQLVGGGSRSAYWAQLLSNILGISLEVSESASVGAALGAARLARLTTLPQDSETWVKVCKKPAMQECYEPNPAAAARLESRYALYRQAYQTNKFLFEALQQDAGKASPTL